MIAKTSRLVPAMKTAKPYDPPVVGIFRHPYVTQSHDQSLLGSTGIDVR